MKEALSSAPACQICKSHKKTKLIPAALIRPALVDLIRRDHPDWSPDGYICQGDLDIYRARYVQESLEAEKGELSKIEQAVIKSLEENEIIAKNLNKEFDSKMSFGERAADKVASFGGSWKFIGIFTGVLLLWILINALFLSNKGFDPYPFILLNLVLSCVASLQAPIIMMSQNRQSAKDRLQAEHDYQVNLKAEVEIRTLHEKMDHLIQDQWQRLLEIQQIQTDLVEELVDRSAGRGTREGSKTSSP
jgi:uncharacterized membrane protein